MWWGISCDSSTILLFSSREHRVCVTAYTLGYSVVSSLTSLIAVGDLGKPFPPVRLWYFFSRAASLSFSWNIKPQNHYLRIHFGMKNILQTYILHKTLFIIQCEEVTVHLLEHLQREGSVFSQSLTLLRCLLAELVSLVLQSRHLLLKKTA